MYNVITRKSDGAVMDCRPETSGIKDVLKNQIIVNYGGTAGDYEITISEAWVDVWQDPAKVLADKWSEIRSERNLLLTESDWTQGNDSPLSAEVKAAWAKYRQALRDIPQQYADPDLIIRPEPPE